MSLCLCLWVLSGNRPTTVCVSYVVVQSGRSICAGFRPDESVSM